jgi:hypothetical protein
MLLKAWTFRNKTASRCSPLADRRTLDVHQIAKNREDEDLHGQAIKLVCTSAHKHKTQDRSGQMVYPPACVANTSHAGRRLVGDDIILNTEIYLSQLALLNGFNIQSLTPFSQGWDYRMCGGVQVHPKGSPHARNPLTLGDAASPLESIFVKFGGEMVRTHRIHKKLCACLAELKGWDEDSRAAAEVRFPLQRSEADPFGVVQISDS